MYLYPAACVRTHAAIVIKRVSKYTLKALVEPLQQTRATQSKKTSWNPAEDAWALKQPQISSVINQKSPLE